FIIARGHAHRLQRHTADRAASRLIADDLGMHGTGVFRSLLHRRWPSLFAQITTGIRAEFGRAARRAEIMPLALVMHEMPRRSTVHFHSADGIRGLQICLGIGSEAVAAGRAAEMVGPTRMDKLLLAFARVNDHSANRIVND